MRKHFKTGQDKTLQSNRPSKPEKFQADDTDAEVRRKMFARLSSYFGNGFLRASTEIGERPFPFLRWLPSGENKCGKKGLGKMTNVCLDLKNSYDRRNEAKTIRDMFGCRRIFTLLAICLTAWIAAGQELLRMDPTGISSNQIEALLLVSSGMKSECSNRDESDSLSLEQSIGERKLVVVNPLTHANAVFDCVSQSVSGKLKLTRLLMAEMRNAGLGDADMYSCIVVEKTGEEYVPVERSDVKVPQNHRLPMFRYGRRGDVRLAQPNERKLKSVSLNVPVPIFADNVSKEDRNRILDEFKKFAADGGCYRYEYVLPNGDSTTFSADNDDESSSVDNVTAVGNFRILDWSDSTTVPASSEQLAPIDAGAQTWDSVLTITQPVKVKVGFANLNSGTLGSSYWPETYTKDGIQYPAALIDQINGEDMHPNSDCDIKIRYSKNFSFYYGTDGNCPSTKVDLRTVATHELCHGLGFTSRHYRGSDNQTPDGSWDGGYPAVFDSFLYYNGYGRLTGLSKSDRLAAFTSGKLFWDGEEATKANGESRVKMCAPVDYTGGSSVVHWDDSVAFKTFMRQSASYGEVCHEVDTRLLGAFKDMGWTMHGDSPSGATPTIPAAPTVAISGTTLSWSAPAGAKYYKVYLSTNPYADPVAITDWMTDRSYQISKPTAEGMCYFYFVKAASAQDDATASPFNAVKVVTGDKAYTLLQYTNDRNYAAYNNNTEFHLYGSGANSETPYNASPCAQTAGGNLKFTSTRSADSGITVTANGTNLAMNPSIANSFLGKWTLKITTTANTSTTPRFYSFYSNATAPSGWSGSVYGQNYTMWIARPHYIYQSGVASFSIGSTSQSVEKEGGTYSVTVSATPSTTSWSASTSADWITLYRTSSSGSGVLGYIVAENTTGSQRTGKITLTGASTTKTLTVTQDGLGTTVSLSSISISGASSIASGGNTTYTCTATMSDGTTKAVTPTWSIPTGSSYASISTSGKLTANMVTSSQNITVKASYTEDAVTKTATKSVAINPPAVLLSSISITGPDYVYAGKTGTFAASATMSDGTTKSITPTWLIYSGTSYASISTAGVLTGKTVSSAQTVTVKASYTEGGVTKTATKTVTIYPTFSLATALDNSTLTFTTGGNADWFGQDKTTYDGTDAARSGIITHNQNSWMQTTVTGPGTFSFRWYASSEINGSNWYDYLTFSIDGVQKDKIGGTSCSWTQCSYTLGAGSHTLKWNYLKDGSYDKGEDAGFVDQIVWTPTPVLPDAPTGVSATDGTYSDKVSISWTGSSGATSYNLYRSTTSTRPSAATKTGVTSPYSDTTATPGTKYYYWVSAVNSAGSSYSSYDTGYRSVLLSVGATTASFDAEGGTGTIAVTANTSWSATADVDWITFTTSSGSGSGNVVYIVAANPSTRPRKDGRITITAGTVTKVITVTQDGVEIVILPDLSFATFSSWTQDETSVYVSDVWSNDAVRVCGKGKVFGVNYGFANFGDAIASGTITNLVEIMDEHMNVVLTEYDSWTISLAQNRGYDNNFMLTTKIKNLPAGPYTARVTLDAFNAIRESDESDNTHSYKFAVSDPVSLNEALDNATLTFVSDEKSGWFGTKGLGADGVDAAQSTHNGNSSISSLQTIVTGPGTIAFKWKVSSEEDYDELRFLIDGVMRLSKSGTEDGWEECSYELSSGTHIVTWSYCKDGSYYDGGDCGWVDQVVWTSNASQSDIVIPGVVTLPKVEVESFMTRYSSLAAQAGGNAESFVKLPSAIGKLDANGNQMYVWQDIVAGTDPTNPNDKFRIVDIKFEDGEIKVVWSPDLNENGTKNVRKYTEFGRKKLGGTETWMDMNGIAPAKKNDYKFRKVTVEMP